MALVTNSDTANPGVPGGSAAISIVSFNRPANDTNYVALDIVSDSTSTSAALDFPNTGRSGVIHRASMSYAGTDTTLWRLWLFDGEPTNFVDGGPLLLLAADMPKIIGKFDFVDADKLLVTAGGSAINYFTASGATTAANEISGAGYRYATADSRIYGLLQDVTGMTTPVSGAEIVIRLEIERA